MVAGEEKTAERMLSVFALHSDRLDPLDIFGGKRELFSLKVFFHMLRARRAG